MIRIATIALGCALLSASHATAQTQPPVQSRQDEACRQEAADRALSDPRQDPYVLGRQIWEECMRRAARAERGGNPSRARR